MGRLTISEVFEVEANYDLVSAEELLYENILSARYLEFSKMVEFSLGKIARMIGNSSCSNIAHGSLTEWYSKVEINNPDIIRAKIKTKINA